MANQTSGIIIAPRVSSDAAKQLDKYSIFRAVIESNKVTYYSESLLRADVEGILTNMPAGLVAVQGFLEPMDVWGKGAWITL